METGKDIELVALGINHKVAPVEVRERVAIPRAQIARVLETLRSEYQADSALVLSTCNRVEFYVVAASAEPLRRFLLDRKFLTQQELDGLAYLHVGPAAVRHLFAVASGIDSMVLGEAEILGQVKEAYQIATEAGAVDGPMHGVFQDCFRAAGQVRSQTRIAHGHVSVSSVAVEMAEKVFSTLRGRSVLIVGTGEMAEGALRALLDRGVQAPFVASRTLERAAELAQRYGGQPLALSELGSVLPKADVVLVSTTAPHYVLGPEHVRAALRARRNAPMLIIDISVPRTVDPAVNDLDNVYLSNIDELEQVAAQNAAEREHELQRCWEIIDAAAIQSYARLRSQEVSEVAAGLRSSFDAVRQEELKNLFRKLPNLAEAEREEVRRMTQRLQNRLLHGPLSALREEAGRDRGTHFIQAIKRLFGLGN